ncbi:MULTISPECIES: acyl carrier protein [unclassified Clostridium]|uniref:acyl carrier protein n=1 Tax=unclassified Clostridium TaxID=2614128 RepID=UPI0025BCB124|nr:MULTISPECIES: acyl carrier protein [unclassified Clostridium]
MCEIKEKVKIFLSRFFKKHELKDDEDIFSLGFINSLFAMQLVMFLEKEFNIKVDNNDLDFDNFRTIDAIVNFVQSKVTS